MHNKQSLQSLASPAGLKQGFSMIETMVALTILVIIGTAIISLTLTVISSNTTAKLRNQGLGFAEEGLEQVRNYFQTNGFQSLYGIANGTCYADGTLQTPISPCPDDPGIPPLPTPPDCLRGMATSNNSFYRAVRLTRAMDNSVVVRSVVTWNDRNACRYTEVGTYFYSY